MIVILYSIYKADIHKSDIEYYYSDVHRQHCISIAIIGPVIAKFQQYNNKLEEWWMIPKNPKKSEAMLLLGWKRRRSSKNNIIMTEEILWRPQFKFYGVGIDDKLTQAMTKRDWSHKPALPTAEKSNTDLSS